MPSGVGPSVAATSPQRRRMSKRRLFGLFLLGFLLVAGTMLAVKYRQWRATPSYWEDYAQQLKAMPDQQKREVAESFRNRLLEQWNAPDAGATPEALIEAMRNDDDLVGETRTITIPYNEFNIWLEAEARGVMEDRGTPLPPTVRQAMVTSDGHGHLILAIDYRSKDVNQVFSFVLDIDINADAQVISRVVEVRGGRLELPRDSAVSMVREQLAREGAGGGDAILKLLTGEPFGPVDIPLDPSAEGVRDGRIVGIAINDDALQLTRTTVRRQPPER